MEIDASGRTGQVFAREACRGLPLLLNMNILYPVVKMLYYVVDIQMHQLILYKHINKIILLKFFFTYILLIFSA